MKPLLLLALLPSAAIADCDDPKLMVERPFATEAALTNFAKCVAVDEEVLKVLPRVERMCYSVGERTAGCVPGSDGCKPKDDHFEGRRTFYLNVDDAISPSAVNARLRTMQKDGCDKFMLDGFSGGVERRQASYNFSFRYADRACDKILGTHTICSGHINGNVKYSLSNNLDVVPSSHRGNPDGRCLGIIPTGSSFGLLNFVLFDSPTAIIVDLVTSKAFNGPRTVALPGITGVSSATVPSLELTNMDYTKEPDLGGFEDINGKYVLESTEHGYLPGFMRSAYVDERYREIDFLRRLSEEPESYVVKPGDTLGAIALRAYRDPRLYLVLDYYNSIDGRPIRTGEVVTIPQPHEVCELINKNRSAVRKGESIWRKKLAGDLAEGETTPQVHSGDPDLIYPYEVLEKKRVSDPPKEPAQPAVTPTPMHRED